MFKAKQLKTIKSQVISTTGVSHNNLRNTADTSTNEREPSDLIERVEQPAEHTGSLTWKRVCMLIISTHLISIHICLHVTS